MFNLNSNVSKKWIPGECWNQSRLDKRCKTPVYLDASTAAFAHSVGHSSTWGVNHGHEADEAQAGEGEVGAIRVKLIAGRKLVDGQEVVTET